MRPHAVGDKRPCGNPIAAEPTRAGATSNRARAAAWTSFALLVASASAAVAQQPPAPPPKPATAEQAWPVARKVLERRCASCHVTGDERARAAPKWPDLLAAEHTAARLDLVRPANPDASPLFTTFLLRSGHHDLLSDRGTGRTSPEEHIAVRDWIAALPPRSTAASQETATTPIAKEQSPLELSVTLDRSSYRKGEAIKISVSASRTCNLTLISLDTAGRSTVLFPSEFAAGSPLTPGTPLLVPARGAQYVLRADTPGRETIVARCLVDVAVPFGIRHDFDRRRFTELGEYRAFLLRAWMLEDQARDAAERPEPPRRRNRKPDPPPLRAAPFEQVQTAVQFDVE